MAANSLFRRLRQTGAFVAVLLAIEFLDELVFGAQAAAWPLIRDELALSYVHIGLLGTLPSLTSSVIEPVLGILADVWKRRVLVLGGGIAYALGLFLFATAADFTPLLLAMVLLYPASGAFVSLSQATLMDADPARHEQNMARWTFAGSLGVVIGPLALGAAVALALGWRGLFVALAALTIVIVAVAWRFRFPRSSGGDDDEETGFRAGLAGAGRALRRREVWRWLILLQASDLLLDILLGLLALYFVDVVGATAAQAGVAVAVWSVVGLVGDFLIIPLLERVRGLAYLRVSALLQLAVFPAFLLVPGILPKLALLAALGLLNAGWYAILQGRLYSAMPGQSGTVVAVVNIAGIAGGLIPLALGALADRFGLGPTMWLLLLAPLAALVGLPRDGGESAAGSRASV